MSDHCWCTMCGARFSEAEIKDAVGCPKCGDRGNPCAATDDLMVTVNWHELRILGIWAENWAQHCERTSPGEKGNARVEVIHAITRRLQRQFPEKTQLTLSAEIMQIKDHGYGIEGYNVAENSLIPTNGPGAIAPLFPLVTAARELIASRFESFRAKNGRDMGVQDQSGEKCWIVPFDQMAALEDAVTLSAPK